jgi:FMN phosphatase YigB (HAD superfamily)
MPTTTDRVFLFDVDNTLLDNDAFERELGEYLERALGIETRERYFHAFEALRGELSYADYLGAVQRLRLQDLEDPRLLTIAGFLLDYPFASRLYPRVPEVLARCAAAGSTVILSDGDAVFQPHKLKRSGIWDAVEGRVLIYVHKEKMLSAIEQRYPAAHYVMVDDKLGILAAMKRSWAARLTTIFPRQGRYAHDPAQLEGCPPANLTLERIGELASYDLAALPGVR